MLTFVPTPIGNLEDISFRSLQALKDAELILAEDTRVTKQLLNLINQKLNFQINTDSKQFLSVHSHNETKFTSDQFINTFKEQNCAYVSDAGMPCVSDPGAILVNFCIQNKIPYDVIPGANALLTAYAMCGFNQKEFLFYGFLPHKAVNRKSPLASLMNNEYLTILYESPHRIIQLLDEIYALDPQKEVFLVKELTKIYQRSFKGKIEDIIDEVKQSDTRGEWVVILNSVEKNLGEHLTNEDIKELNIPPKQKAKLLSKMTGKPVKEIYESL